MAIPDYQSIMLPLLQLAGDEEEHSSRQVIDVLADGFELSDEERRELLPSGRQPAFNNRVGWACTYLKKAALLEATRRGFFEITERGLGVLQDRPTVVNVAFLKQYPEFMAFHNPRQAQGTDTTGGDADDE